MLNNQFTSARENSTCWANLTTKSNIMLDLHEVCSFDKLLSLFLTLYILNNSKKGIFEGVNIVVS